jgi:hypothetical protein
MEKLIKQFLRGNGDGYGNGNGNGYGDGYGNGYGDGDGDGYGNGYGDGDGDGDGYGNGYGYGDGYGNGYGDGDGDGYGYGDGNGITLKTYKGQPVYYIDGIPCTFTTVHKSLAFAKVTVIGTADFSATPQYVYKFNDCFAHGHTLKQAKADAENKYFSTIDISERILTFKIIFKAGVKYDADKFYEWHSILTGSCQSGKEQWVKQNVFDMTRKLTVAEFIELTKNSYGSEIIRQLN